MHGPLEPARLTVRTARQASLKSRRPPGTSYIPMMLPSCRSMIGSQPTRASCLSSSAPMPLPRLVTGRMMAGKRDTAFFSCSGARSGISNAAYACFQPRHQLRHAIAVPSGRHIDLSRAKTNSGSKGASAERRAVFGSIARVPIGPGMLHEGRQYHLCCAPSLRERLRLTARAAPAVEADRRASRTSASTFGAHCFSNFARNRRSTFLFCISCALTVSLISDELFRAILVLHSRRAAHPSSTSPSNQPASRVIADQQLLFPARQGAFRPLAPSDSEQASYQASGGNPAFSNPARRRRSPGSGPASGESRRGRLVYGCVFTRPYI